MKTAEVPLTAPELKFLIDVLWGAPIDIVRKSAQRHHVSDNDVEGHLVKSLGYLSCEID